ncbi:hypothetical protein ACFFJY_01270 [Fictibacillus aquaticus]|uniref:Uncharacterized protein n=1 Tax=Fictibacillus aquaticus TaxID=2021314 RepID=A0A235F7W6_9BACL|nr:hypothetical protein [Fictibacillus aquaticus]OYD57348.1 hypothetical protein CGZ90_11745 [Fictibacillus aquaticus]
METNLELIQSLDRFRRILVFYDDCAESLPVVTKFLRSFLQIKTPNSSLPTMELMAILRHEKPNIVYYLRHYCADDTMRMLSLLKMDYKKAQRRIEQLSQYRSITRVKRFNSEGF